MFFRYFVKNFDIFFLFSLLKDCSYNLESPQSTHNICFRSKMRKNRYTTAYQSFANIKVGYKGVYITRTYFPEDGFKSQRQFKRPPLIS